MLDFLWLPFLACLVLTGIHVYLGLHVLARGVIFVDLALAQVAALGISVAFLAGHPSRAARPTGTRWPSRWAGPRSSRPAACTARRSRRRRSSASSTPVSAAAAVLVVDRAPQGGEHIKTLLVGSILTVTPRRGGAARAPLRRDRRLHWLVRRPLLEISLEPDAARAHGRRLRWWDFFFYITFGIVVTSSVRSRASCSSSPT